MNTVLRGIFLIFKCIEIHGFLIISFHFFGPENNIEL